MPRSILHTQLMSRVFLPLLKNTFDLFSRPFSIDSPTPAAHSPQIHRSPISPRRVPCPISATKLVTPKKLGPSSCKIPRIASKPSAPPSKNSAAKFTPRSSPLAPSTSWPSPNFKTTSPPRPLPSPSQPVVQCQTSRPFPCSPPPKLLKLCARQVRAATARSPRKPPPAQPPAINFQNDTLRAS